MLNELRSLHESLVACGIDPPQQHPAVRRLKRSDGLVVGLDEGGQPLWAEFKTAKEMKRYWQIAPDNQNSFPSINVPPLFRSTSTLSVERAKLRGDDERIAWLGRVVSEAELRDQAALVRRLHELPEKLLPVLRSSDSLAAYAALAERLITGPSFGDLAQQLARTAVDLVRQGTLAALDVAESLMLGKWSARSNDFDQTKVTTTVLFDLADYAAFGSRTARIDAGRDLISAMSTFEGPTAGEGLCVISGRRGPVVGAKFPQPNLPALGLTYLFSANKYTPAQHNYGVFGAKAFRIGEATVEELNSSLAYVTAESRKGKTWQIMPDERGPRLVIAYVRERLEDFDLASLLVESPSELSEASYAETCSSVCKALRARSVPANAVLELFILSKPVTGRAQVQAASYSVGQVLQAAEEWQQAAENAPAYSVKIGDEERGTGPVSPARIARLTQSTWIRRGSRRNPIRGLAVDQIYASFLGEGELGSRASRQLLAAMLQRHTGLLTGPMKGRPALEDSAAVVSLLATLLYKLGRRKGEYMNDAPYQIGRMLALVDTLHREYCKHVRKAAYPPQLLGNSLMHTALDNPTKGLARLSERILPYQAWAQGGDSALAKWALKEMAEASQLIADSGPSQRTDEMKRAEILLGYLARPKKETKDDGTIQ